MLGGCQTQSTIAPCHVDLSLIQEIEIDGKPAQPIVGSLADSRRTLADKVRVDNEKKARARGQIRSCGTP